MTATDFNQLAKFYDVDKVSLWHDLYERPTSIKLMGNINGLNLLDAGCGAGKHSADLLAKGASVSGCDISAKMLQFAKDALGDQMQFKIADLSNPLPYAEAEFDGILCALALHFIKDWKTPLSEFHRLLKPGGRLVFSTLHPFIEIEKVESENYFAHAPIENKRKIDGETMLVRYWRRPLTQMIEEINASGLQIETIKEPMPLETAKEKFPDAYEKLTTQPRFIFFVLKKPA
ncbi:class I SAM-dependent methyltransferase [Maritalea porphyrae]|uniref:class I SAM-dependent methyltransferase n=1 Tax=Maritalea porphyrae TaxID=880732 RepID=UPI0022AF8BA7|nr:class I SAM-dependent methyltransferase [Maritalea porphyrae]MCZ4273897.1 class I SAM-dependent methyltransferase [Maritalea porphyrae]